MKPSTKGLHMPNSTIPLFYYPTTVILIDDNKFYIDTLKESLALKSIDCLCFTCPRKALAYITEHTGDNVALAAITQEQDTYTSSDVTHKN
jgi:hypothetical protein